MRLHYLHEGSYVNVKFNLDMMLKRKISPIPQSDPDFSVSSQLILLNGLSTFLKGFATQYLKTVRIKVYV